MIHTPLIHYAAAWHAMRLPVYFWHAWGSIVPATHRPVG